LFAFGEKNLLVGVCLDLWIDFGILDRFQNRLFFDLPATRRFLGVLGSRF